MPILQVHRADCFVHSVGTLAGDKNVGTPRKISVLLAEIILVISNFSLDFHLKAFII